MLDIFLCLTSLAILGVGVIRFMLKGHLWKALGCSIIAISLGALAYWNDLLISAHVTPGVYFDYFRLGIGVVFGIIFAVMFIWEHWPSRTTPIRRHEHLTLLHGGRQTPRPQAVPKQPNHRRRSYRSTSGNNNC